MSSKTPARQATEITAGLVGLIIWYLVEVFLIVGLRDYVPISRNLNIAIAIAYLVGSIWLFFYLCARKT